jgi:hypothetical protein
MTVDVFVACGLTLSNTHRLSVDPGPPARQNNHAHIAALGRPQ